MDEAVSRYDLLGDAVMDAVCRRVFRNQTSMDEVTEGGVLEALREESGMLDTAPSAIGFKTAIKDLRIW